VVGRTTAVPLGDKLVLEKRAEVAGEERVDVEPGALQRRPPALLHFHAYSPYLCEVFHIMAAPPVLRPSSTNWGSLLYLKLYQRLLVARIWPSAVLPWCFTEGRSCRLDNRLPDPFAADKSSWCWFGRPPSSPASAGSGASWWPLGGGSGRVEEGGLLDTALGHVFGVHLHNQWEKAFPKGGWVERLLLDGYNKKLGLGRATERRGSAEGIDGEGVERT
jgi:hypothetical protein